MTMRNITKGLLLSVVVIALAASSLHMATYGWLSDSQEYNVEITGAECDVDLQIYSGNNPVEGDTVKLSPGSNGLELRITNHGDVPVSFETKFSIPRYFANNTSLTPAYGGDLIPTQDGFEKSDDLTTYHNGGQREQSIGSIKATFDSRDPSGLVGSANRNMGSITIDGQEYTVLYTEYSISYSESLLLPGRTVSIPLTIEVGEGYTEGSILDPVISVEGVQANSSGDIENIDLIETPEGTFSATANLSDITDSPGLKFSDQSERYTITLDWQAVSTSDAEDVTVTVTETAESITIDVDSGTTALNGRISYSIQTDGGVTGVLSGTEPISCQISSSDGTVTVSFTDPASEGEHTITLAQTGGSHSTP